MSSVELRNITKRFTDVVALSDVSFTVQDKEFFVLLGPTGAGKTTTLRIIAALARQDEGGIFFDGEPVDELGPADRDVAMVFQQYSLYPTMTVFDNLAFPLRSPLRKVPEADIRTAGHRRWPRCCASAICWSARPHACPAARCSAWPSAGRSCATRGSS